MPNSLPKAKSPIEKPLKIDHIANFFSERPKPNQTQISHSHSRIPSNNTGQTLRESRLASSRGEQKGNYSGRFSKDLSTKNSTFGVSDAFDEYGMGKSDSRQGKKPFKRESSKGSRDERNFRESFEPKTTTVSVNRNERNSKPKKESCSVTNFFKPGVLFENRLVPNLQKESSKARKSIEKREVRPRKSANPKVKENLLVEAKSLPKRAKSKKTEVQLATQPKTAKKVFREEHKKTKPKTTKKKEKAALTIQRWWRSIKSKRMLMKKNSPKETGIKKKTVNPSGNSSDSSSKKKDLKTILTKCRELSKIQTQQWQGVLSQIKNLDVSQSQLSFIKKLEEESKKTIQFLNRFRSFKKKSNVNVSSSMGSFSMERKMIEKWLQPDESLLQKNAYELLHENVFGNSKLPSRTSNSKKLNISAKKIDQHDSMGLLRFLRIEHTPESSLKVVSPKKSLTEKLNLKSQLVETLFDEFLLEALRFAQSQSLIKAPPAPLTEESLNNILYDLSEIILYTKYSDLRIKLSFPQGPSLAVMLGLSRSLPPILPTSKSEFSNLLEKLNAKNTHPFLFLFSQALEEALDFFRPKKKNFPFGNFDGKAPLISEADSVKNLENACNLLLAWTEVMAGLMIEGDGAQKPSIEGSETGPKGGYLGRLKEERMKKLIEGDVKEENDAWVGCEEEKFKIGNEVAEFVFEEVLKDCVNFLGF